MKSATTALATITLLFASCSSSSSPSGAANVPTSTRAAAEAPSPKASPTSLATTTRGPNCDAAYPTVCIPSPPPDLDCKDVKERRFKVLAPDPHKFDADGNGIGCEGQ